MSAYIFASLAALEAAHEKSFADLVNFINDKFSVGTKVIVRGTSKYHGAKSVLLRGTVAHLSEPYHRLNVLIRSAHGRLHHRHYKYVEIDE